MATDGFSLIKFHFLFLFFFFFWMGSVLVLSSGLSFGKRLGSLLELFVVLCCWLFNMAIIPWFCVAQGVGICCAVMRF